MLIPRISRKIFVRLFIYLFLILFVVSMTRDEIFILHADLN